MHKATKLAFFGSIALSVSGAMASQAYDNTGANAGGAGGNLNIGHEFSVTGSGITVTALGVYDNSGHALIDSHDVTLFSLTGFSANPPATALTTINIAAGQSSATDFVFGNITPIFLPAGTYGIAAYGLNSAGGDPYGDGGGLPAGAPGTPNVFDDAAAGFRFDPYQFTSAGSPLFPQNGDANDHASASFLYNVGNTTPEPASLSLLGLGAIGLLARRRQA